MTDGGIGIPSSDLSKVFECGYHASNATALAGGLGVGLASVRSIVQAHRGTISIDSQEGVGTAVTVRLPLQRRSFGDASRRNRLPAQDRFA